jgi:hypothetical protein
MSKIDAIQAASGNTAESRRTWWLSVKPFINADKAKVKDLLMKAFGSNVSIRPDKIEFK